MAIIGNIPYFQTNPHDMVIRGGGGGGIKAISCQKEPRCDWHGPNPVKMSDTRFNRLLTTPFDVVASVNQAVTGGGYEEKRTCRGYEVR